MRHVICAFMVLSSVQALGIETDKAAHFGLSFAATTGFYGVGKMVCPKDKPACKYIVGIVGGLAVGAIKEATDRRPDINDMAANAAGVGTAAATILFFDF